MTFLEGLLKSAAQPAEAYTAQQATADANKLLLYRKKIDSTAYFNTQTTAGRNRISIRNQIAAALVRDRGDVNGPNTQALLQQVMKQCPDKTVVSDICESVEYMCADRGAAEQSSHPTLQEVVKSNIWQTQAIIQKAYTCITTDPKHGSDYKAQCVPNATWSGKRHTAASNALKDLFLGKQDWWGRRAPVNTTDVDVALCPDSTVQDAAAYQRWKQQQATAQPQNATQAVPPTTPGTQNGASTGETNSAVAQASTAVTDADPFANVEPVDEVRSAPAMQNSGLLSGGLGGLLSFAPLALMSKNPLLVMLLGGLLGGSYQYGRRQGWWNGMPFINNALDTGDEWLANNWKGINDKPWLSNGSEATTDETTADETAANGAEVAQTNELSAKQMVPRYMAYVGRPTRRDSVGKPIPYPLPNPTSSRHSLFEPIELDGDEYNQLHYGLDFTAARNAYAPASTPVTTWPPVTTSGPLGSSKPEGSVNNLPTSPSTLRLPDVPEIPPLQAAPPLT